MEPTAGLTRVHPQARLGLLEGGKETQVRLDFRAEAEGALRIQGRLEARDLDGNPFSLDFAFQIRIARAGRIYESPPYQPYVMSEGLASDRTFVGREDLLEWLRGLWLQPEGKPAVVLVGQRRRSGWSYRQARWTEPSPMRPSRPFYKPPGKISGPDVSC